MAVGRGLMHGGLGSTQRPGGLFPSRYVGCMLETISRVYSYVAGCLFGINQERREMQAKSAQLWK